MIRGSPPSTLKLDSPHGYTIREMYPMIRDPRCISDLFSHIPSKRPPPPTLPLSPIPTLMTIPSKHHVAANNTGQKHPTIYPLKAVAAPGFCPQTKANGFWAQHPLPPPLSPHPGDIFLARPELTRRCSNDDVRQQAAERLCQLVSASLHHQAGDSINPNKVAEKKDLEPTRRVLCVGDRCEHVEYWKRLRAKKGTAFYICKLCGCKWKIVTTTSADALVATFGHVTVTDVSHFCDHVPKHVPQESHDVTTFFIKPQCRGAESEKMVTENGYRRSSERSGEDESSEGGITVFTLPSRNCSSVSEVVVA